MRIPRRARHPVLPGGSGIEAANERPRFNSSKQPSRDTGVGLDPSDMVRLGSRRKAPFVRRRKRGQAVTLLPGFAGILGSKNRARLGSGVDDAATLSRSHLLTATDWTFQ